MKLRQAHQILIGSAIGLAILLSLRSLLQYTRTHVAADLLLALLSLAVAAALAAYLRHVRAKWSLDAGRGH
jgi:hypothetical protein